MIDADREGDNAVLLRQVVYKTRLETLREQGRSAAQAKSVAGFENPFNYLIYQGESAIPGFPLGAEKYEIFWNKFNHKYLHFMTVASYSFNHSSWDTAKIGEVEAAESLVYTHKELKRFLREEAAITHPQEAERLFLLLSKSAR